ncbi:MAG: CoA-binding protein [Saprospiraceae bacterium]|nr:CoA-binding protein [Bacteroidia bacterium]NNL91685.1 CoA-binding protein [Saprospiraceae bacterium]
MNNKKTLIIGASTNPERYSNRAVHLLNIKGNDVIALGRKEGAIGNTPILTSQDQFENVDTISIYIREELQSEIEDYIISLNPRRVIFNPGSENLQLSYKLRSLSIDVENACTLVLLQTDQY